ncbi:MAG: hypothetical protein LBN05_08410 [Oscillospiraceae bacterium]|jgi:hypothetical protein|nr:hypothetical protein [Oscillospiraceae bacterium]
MYEFYNAGSRCIVLDGRGESALIARVDNKQMPFVVVGVLCRETQDWYHGQYFDTITKAMEYWNKLNAA